MWYTKLNDVSDPQRIAKKLLEIKKELRQSGVPVKDSQHMLLATWNIREFDSTKGGERGYEALYYIAEIISHFDIIAIQEIRGDLVAFKKVVRLLGNEWDYIASDETAGVQGNGERMVFLYDTRKVSFTGIAGEIVLPPVKEKTNGGERVYNPIRQLYRTPYLCGFRSGWVKFFLTTVHIRYGKDDPNDPERVREIFELAKFLKKRSKVRAANNDDQKYYHFFLLGDFNIYSPQDATMQALTSNGFMVPEELEVLPHTNVGKKKRHYDQIAFIPKKRKLEFTKKAGVFDFFKTVYRDAEEQMYVEQMDSLPKATYSRKSNGNQRTAKEKERFYKTYWRTHQMSDHFPMWVQIKTNFEEEFLTDFGEIDDQ